MCWLSISPSSHTQNNPGYQNLSPDSFVAFYHEQRRSGFREVDASDLQARALDLAQRSGTPLATIIHLVEPAAFTQSSMVRDGLVQAIRQSLAAQPDAVIGLSVETLDRLWMGSQRLGIWPEVAAMIGGPWLRARLNEDRYDNAATIHAVHRAITRLAPHLDAPGKTLAPSLRQALGRFVTQRLDEDPPWVLESEPEVLVTCVFLADPKELEDATRALVRDALLSVVKSPERFGRLELGGQNALRLLLPKYGGGGEGVLDWWGVKWMTSTATWTHLMPAQGLGKAFYYTQAARRQDTETGGGLAGTYFNHLRNRLVFDSGLPMEANWQTHHGVSHALLALVPRLSSEEMDDLASNVVEGFVAEEGFRGLPWDVGIVAHLFQTQASRGKAREALLGSDGLPRYNIARLLSAIYSGSDEAMQEWRGYLDRQIAVATQEPDRRASWLLARSAASSGWALPDDTDPRTERAWVEAAYESATGKAAQLMCLRYLVIDDIKHRRFEEAVALVDREKGSFSGTEASAALASLRQEADRRKP